MWQRIIFDKRRRKKNNCEKWKEFRDEKILKEISYLEGALQPWTEFNTSLDSKLLTSKQASTAGTQRILRFHRLIPMDETRIMTWSRQSGTKVCRRNVCAIRTFSIPFHPAHFQIVFLNIYKKILKRLQVHNLYQLLWNHQLRMPMEASAATHLLVVGSAAHLIRIKWCWDAVPWTTMQNEF